MWSPETHRHESEAISRNYTHIDTTTKRKAVDSIPDDDSLEIVTFKWRAMRKPQ